MGRMALFSDNKGKVALAKTARDHAVIALQKAPELDLAHHLMGRYVVAASCLELGNSSRCNKVCVCQSGFLILPECLNMTSFVLAFSVTYLRSNDCIIFHFVLG